MHSTATGSQLGSPLNGQSRCLGYRMLNGNLDVTFQMICSMGDKSTLPLDIHTSRAPTLQKHKQKYLIKIIMITK